MGTQQQKNKDVDQIPSTPVNSPPSAATLPNTVSNDLIWQQLIIISNKLGKIEEKINQHNKSIDNINEKVSSLLNWRTCAGAIIAFFVFIFSAAKFFNFTFHDFLSTKQVQTHTIENKK